MPDATLAAAPVVATGVGSLPGTDIEEAVRVVFGELPDLPHLPELPARGPGAAMIGRTAAALAELHVDLQPAGWRLVARPGVDERRAQDLLGRDLDALEAFGATHAGPLKVGLAGPWTLAANVELPRGDRALSDAGAVRDLAASLEQTVREFTAELRRRLPSARLVMQFDEPALPAVLAGRVPTASGFGALPVPAEGVAVDLLRQVLAAAAEAGSLPVVHCCDDDAPVSLLVEAGARAVSLDPSRLSAAAEEAVGSAVEQGTRFFLGVVPSVDAELSAPSRTVDPVRHLWRRLGFPADRLLGDVVVTPTCGLAHASPGYARTAMRHCRDAARALSEAPEISEAGL